MRLGQRLGSKYALISPGRIWLRSKVAG